MRGARSGAGAAGSCSTAAMLTLGALADGGREEAPHRGGPVHRDLAGQQVQCDGGGVAQRGGAQVDAVPLDGRLVAALHPRFYATQGLAGWR